MYDWRHLFEKKYILTEVFGEAVYNYKDMYLGKNQYLQILLDYVIKYKSETIEGLHDLFYWAMPHIQIV